MRIIQPYQPTTQTAAVTTAPVRHNRFSTQRTAGTMPVWEPKTVETAAFVDPAATPKVETRVDDKQRLGFKDLLDVVNPLQHIPLVDIAYRKLTGDQISAPAQFMGGFLFGGPIGGVAAMADIAMKDQTGKSFGDRAIAMFDKNDAGATPDANSPVIKLATRWKDEPRMAGTIPVWGNQTLVAAAQNVPSSPLTGNKLAPDTNFAMLLNTLSDTTPNIS